MKRKRERQPLRWLELHQKSIKTGKVIDDDCRTLPYNHLTSPVTNSAMNMYSRMFEIELDHWRTMLGIK